MWRVVVDTLKDASARSDVLSTGVRTASFVSNARHLVSRGEFFAGLFILGFANGIFGRIAGRSGAGLERDLDHIRDQRSRMGGVSCFTVP